MAQATQPPAQEQTPPAQPPAQSPPTAGAGIPSTTTVEPSKPAPPKEPFVLDDGGIYIQPMYWLNKAQPRLRGGLMAANGADFQYGGNAKAALGAEIGIPAGRSNTLRVSYFRVQGNSGVTLGKDALIFGESYTAGEFLNATYKLQAIKASWDYLSYSWHKPSTTIRLKTLYEVQYVTTTFDTAAPFVPATTDATGNTDTNQANGTKSVILPTFGMALGSSFGSRFRWDIRGSGLGFPKRGAIADVQGTVAVRVSKIEIFAGEKFFYFKTSPRTDMYTNDTLQGVFGGIRVAFRGNL